MFKHWKPILRLALPSLISFATMTVTGTVNLILVGQMGAMVIAIVGVTNIMMYNAWALFSGIGHTVNYLVAQNFGAGEIRNAIERTYLSLYLGCLVGLGLGVTGLIAADELLRLVSGSAEITAAGAGYLSLRLVAMTFGTVNFVFHGFFRGIGDTRTPMVLSLISNTVIIALTYALTYGEWGFPELGLIGAGCAYCIGEAIGLAGALYMFLFRLHGRYRTRVRIGFNWPESKLILSESGKLGVQEFSLSVSMFVFTMFVARLGTEALAANEIALNVMGFGFMPAFAFGATATILVGQEIGKGRPLSARRMGTETAVLGGLLLLLIGAVELVWAEPISRLFTDEWNVYRLAAKLIAISAFLQIFEGILNFYAGGLRGIGDTSFLLKASFALSWLLFIPLAYLLTFYFNLGSTGAWISLYTFLTAFGVTVAVRYYRTDWSRVEMKKASG